MDRSKDELTIRLRGRHQIGSDRYLSLSHCWGAGETQRMKLTSGSFVAFSRGIPMSALQKTFQDLGLVAKHLDVNYLWIDCLCIFQDDPEGWARESVMMDKVYSNRWLNVSACAAENGTEGFFVNRSLGRPHNFFSEMC